MGEEDGRAARPVRSRGLGARLRNARIRSKLGLILVVPLVATVAFAALRLADSAGQLIEAQRAQSLAAVAVEASTVAHQLHQERIAAIGVLSDPQAATDGYAATVSRADEAIAGYQDARSQLGEVPAVVDTRLAVVDEQLAQVGTLREAVFGQRPIAASAAVLRYGAVLADLLAYQESVAAAIDDPVLSEQARAVAAWAGAKAHAADAAAIAALVATGGQISAEQLAAFAATQTGQQEAFLAFGQLAAPEQQAVADQAITGGSVDYRAVTSAADQPAAELLAGAASELSGTVDAARWAERQLHDQLLAAAGQRRDDVFGQVVAESTGVLLALLLALSLAVLLARQLARQLGRLRKHALQVAEKELPATVARLSDPRTVGEDTPAQLAGQVREPAALQSRDEIGQVAGSFAVVHRSAVRIAAEQAALRTSVSAMFLNLARRSQSLVDRMISQLDQIERNEEDPKRLARMFTLDHLATRMRRNDENLLTLAGADSSPPRTADGLLHDVLRAAQSEVEHYERIEFGAVDTDVWVTALAVNDVVRLIAELFDNATRFSPPEAAVMCEARRLRDHVIVQVEDRGVGMAAEQVSRLNTWLASPPTVEVSTFRKMGLAVVARLAARHGIRVELRCEPHHGTVVYVALPPGILVLPPSPLRGRATQSTAAQLLPVGAAPTSAAPPVPSRYVGQSPQRSSDVVRHAATRRGGSATSSPGPDLPVAGRPMYQLTGGATPAPAPVPAPAAASPENSTVELPIFRQVEAVWFASHGQQGLDLDPPAPRAGAYPTPAAETPAAAAAPPPSELGATASRDTGSDQWRTAADPGWQAAAAAADPPAAGATRSGLPKRRPQAQLVPGSVPTATHTGSRPPGQRRSPEEVRGLLAAYHRGVQRGRETHTR